MNLSHIATYFMSIFYNFRICWLCRSQPIRHTCPRSPQGFYIGPHGSRGGLAARLWGSLQEGRLPLLAAASPSLRSRESFAINLVWSHAWAFNPISCPIICSFSLICWMWLLNPALCFGTWHFKIPRLVFDSETTKILQHKARNKKSMTSHLFLAQSPSTRDRVFFAPWWPWARLEYHMALF